jgi:hypothetical protein
MIRERVDRRLAATLAVDVAGHSRLTGQEEAGTLGRHRAHRLEPIDPNLLVRSPSGAQQIYLGAPRRSVRLATIFAAGVVPQLTQGNNQYLLNTGGET